MRSSVSIGKPSSIFETNPSGVRAASSLDGRPRTTATDPTASTAPSDPVDGHLALPSDAVQAVRSDFAAPCLTRRNRRRSSLPAVRESCDFCKASLFAGGFWTANFAIPAG